MAYPHPLDAEAMAQAASYLVGRHDFTSFRATCQANSPVRTPAGWILCVQAMRYICLLRAVIPASSDRNFAGSLVQVGNGK